MKHQKVSSANGGITFLSLLFLLFLGLKLGGIISWSWWVTAPLWCPAALFLTIGIPLLMLYMWRAMR